MDFANQPPTIVSQSGQFLVHGPMSASPAVRGFHPVGANLRVEFSPELLAVTCERTRRTVRLRLGLPDRPGVKTHVVIRPRRQDESRLEILLIPFSDQWQIRLETPGEVEWPRLVRALVDVTLLDQACLSSGGSQSPSIPLWLSEGLDSLIEAEFGRDLIVESQTLLNRASVRRDPLAPSRSAIGNRDPLTIGDLAGPTEDQLADPRYYALYRANAAVLVATLLEDEGKRRFLRDFIGRLGSVLNWQTAFLNASGGGFRSMLEVERWWAVASSDILSRDPAFLWPRERVLAALWDVDLEAAAVASTASPTERKRFRLSQLIGQWSFDAQREVVDRKIRQLRMLGPHAPADVFPLVSDFYRTLTRYFEARDNLGRGLGPTRIETGAPVIVRTARTRLTNLESRLEAAAPQPEELRENSRTRTTGP